MDILSTIIILAISGVNGTAAAPVDETTEELVRATWALTAATIGIAGATIATVFFQTKWNRKTHQVAAMNQVIEWLSNEDMRAHRRAVYKEYCECKRLKQELDYNRTEGLRNHADAVLGSFDRASVLILDNSVDYKQFKKLYSDMFLRSWAALGSDVTRRQKWNGQYALSYSQVSEKLKNEGYKEPEINCDEFRTS